jgi:hypothetical protein
MSTFSSNLPRKKYSPLIFQPSYDMRTSLFLATKLSGLIIRVLPITFSIKYTECPTSP